MCWEIHEALRVAQEENAEKESIRQMATTKALKLMEIAKQYGLTPNLDMMIADLAEAYKVL